MILKHFSYGLSITIISWLVGMVVTALIRKSGFYKKYLSHLNFITNETVNRAIGLAPFKWIVKNTFFKYLNQKLKLKSKKEMGQLHEIREEMTYAEVSHWVGFVFVTGFAVAKTVQGECMSALAMMLVNILLNAYPSLLQQENKRRIDKLIKRFG